jgi:hypothetical protein
MSYSYLTSVFPEFQSSFPNTSAVIIEKSEKKEDKSKNVFTGVEETEMTKFAKNLLTDESITNGYIVPQTKLLEEYSEVNFDKSKHNKDNLHFYNVPYAKQILEQPKRIKVIEGYTGETNCDEYMKHVLECSLCKTAITKQLQIDNDRIRNEEIMELLSYIAFGIFIMLLIDNIKRKN